TTYTVTVTNAATCTATASRIVTVNALPTAAITPASATICAGQSSTLTASGGTSYLWSNAATTAAITVTPAATTTYTVTVTNAATCTAISSATVTVNAAPTAAITPASATICAGQSSTLTASGGTSYLWSNAATTAAITVTPAITTTYTVTVTNAATCTATSSAVVTVNTLPTAAITPASATICAGQSSTLTASGGASYLWSNAATTAAITVTPAATTTYTVTVTNAATCTAIASAVVAVNATPVANAGVDQSIPNGTSTSLTGSASGGSGTYTWLWSPAGQLVSANVQNPTTVNLGTTTTYTLTVTDAVTSCQGTDVVIVTITGSPLSVTTSATPTAICLGSSTQLNALASGGSGIYTYSWTSVPAGFTSTIANPVVSPTVNTTYNVTVNDGSNNATGNVSVTVNAVPVAAITPASATICAGQSSTLTASGGASYLWSNAATTAAITVTPAATTTYTVTVTSADACTATSSAVVTVNSLPVVNAGADQVVCSGTPVILTGSGATSYTWDNGVTDGTPFTPAVGAITYTVTGTTGGCSNTDQVVVTVNALPNVSAGSDQVVCEGTSVTLTGSGATSYTWDNGVIDGASFTPTVGIVTYTVTGTLGSCSNTDQVIVTVNAIPNVNAGADQIICEGLQITLTGSGATSYVWDNGVTDGTPFTQAVGTITYTVTGTSNGCSNTDQIIVTVNASPIASATSLNASCGIADGSATASATGGTGVYTYLWDVAAASQTSATAINLGVGSYTVSVFDGNCTSTAIASVSENGAPTITVTVTNSTICVGQTTTLNATGADTYLWTPSTYLSATTGSSVDATPPTSITYTVQGTTAGCSSIQTIDITVDALPLVNAGIDQVICLGSAVTLSGSGATSYTWDNGVTDGTPFTPSIAGVTTYTVTGTINGCSNTDQVVVTVNTAPVAGFSYIDNGFGNVTFTDLSQGASSWTWTFGDGGIDFTQNPTYTYLANGTYTITQIVQSPCGTNSTSQTINVIIDNVNLVSVSSQLEVFPNPSNGQFNIKYSSNTGNSFEVKIISVTGEVVSSIEYTKTSTSMIIPVNIEKLAKGIYQIKVTNGNEVMNSRIIIDRY
ncbi:MAG: T9SS type A sorting domain-containing protein, partial [Bacteroidia bacterium]|nr:T9SS type A sorting domain-containing protein [Bacteroidia bacterium]